MSLPCRATHAGIELFVRLSPKASRDDVAGTKDFSGKIYLQARVRAVPEDGKANAAVIELIAARLGVPKSSIALASGHSSRLKTLAIAGDASTLEAKVTALLKRIG